MDDSTEPLLRRAILAIAQVDPLITLLQQVREGRLDPANPGLRAVTETWLKTYEQALTMEGLTSLDLRQLDPTPRVAVLVEAGVLSADHQGVTRLFTAFRRAEAVLRGGDCTPNKAPVDRLADDQL